MRRLPWRSATVVVAVVACFAAPAVLADSYDDAATTCAQQVLGQPFLPFDDVASYVIAPGGTFDGQTGWTFGDGASVTDGNEPFMIAGSAGEEKSLLLPAGGTATSEPLCVTLLHPTIRFVVRSNSASGLLSARVLYKDVFGRLSKLEFARIAGTAFWSPTEPLPFLANALAPLATGGATAVAFEFASLRGTWQIDDVYVDPYKDR